MISSKHLAKALYVMSREKDISANSLWSSFDKYVDEYKLHSLLPETLRYLENYNAVEKSWNTADIKLGLMDADDEIISKICKTINVPKDDVSISEDKNLIGGFVLKYQGVIYDNSIKRQVQLLKQNLIKS